MTDYYFESPTVAPLTDILIPQLADESTFGSTNHLQTHEGKVFSSLEGGLLNFDQVLGNSIEPLPPGYTPYADGGYYMQDSEGNISLTPQWQRQVDRLGWRWR